MHFVNKPGPVYSLFNNNTDHKYSFQGKIIKIFFIVTLQNEKKKKILS